jgi:hypothetical protein
LNLPLPDRNEDDERLDDLVRRAVRVDVDPLALDRLAEHWDRQWNRRSWARTWFPLAAAACVLLATGIVLLIVLRQGRGPVVTTQGPQNGAVPHESNAEASQSRNSPRLASDRAGPPRKHQPLAPRAREDRAEVTPYEQLVMVVAMRDSPSADVRQARSVRREIIQHLSDLKRVDAETAEQMAADLNAPLADLERELGQLCTFLRGPRRQKAVELFGKIASRESLDVLLRLWIQPAHQDQVAPAVARLAEPAVLAKCYLQAETSASRQVLAAALAQQLAAGDAGLLIELLNRAPRSAELVAALRSAEASIVDALFAELDAESRPARYAAARALAALDRSDVTRRLIERVAAGVQRQEALFALAASDEPAAVHFVSQASRNAVLATALQSALVQAGASPWSNGG